jgi:2-(1,2-epoxy-1,2-dihydrophenyl)acetyl-CoA isomerase
MSEPVLLVSNHASVRVLCMNRPASKNALDSELVNALGDALESASADAEVRAMVLTGAGGAFSSGVDLRSAQADLDHPERLSQRLAGFHRLIRAITAAPQPVLAAVEGPAVGFGADLALSCDLRLFASSAYVEEKFAAIGLMPDGGGTYHLPRLIGLSRALEHQLLGTRIDAAAAEKLGLALKVVEPERLREEALAVAGRLAAGPPLALSAIKRALRAGLGGSLDEALERERTGQLALLSTRDVREGLQAFFERRAPRFDGG